MGKKHKILPVLFGFFLIAALAVPVRGEKWTFRLSGGAGWFSGGDFNAYLDWANSKTGPAVNRSYNPVHGGLDAGIEVVHWISPAWGIGLGADFLRVARPNNQIVYDYGDTSSHYIHDTIARCGPVHLNLHYLINAGHRLGCDLRAGLAYIWADWSDQYTYQVMTSSNIPTYTYRQEDKASASGFGFHLGAMLSWKITGFFSTVGEILFRWSPIHGFSGTKTYPDQGSDGENAIEGRLYYYEYYYNTNKTWLKAFGVGARPVGEAVRDVGEAVVDFSGVSLRLGFAIHL